MAEGEFAQVTYHVEHGLKKSTADRSAMASDPDMYVMAVEAAVRAHDSEILNKYLPLAEKTAARINHPLYQAIVSRAHGVSHRLAGKSDEAANHLAAALDEFRKLDAPWQIGRTLLELGEVERHRGNNETARGNYSEALEAFESIGAAPDADRARNALEALS